MKWRRVAAPQRAGTYWFLAALGRGGMADIFLVVAQSALGFDKVQVLKRPRLDFLDDPTLVDMFLNEGRLATRLEHANIVRTTEVAVFDGEPYIAMEYVDGLSVHRLLYEAHAGHLQVTDQGWLGLIADVLDALDYAHKLTDFDGKRLGIVHRDVSPGNVMLSYNGVVKLCDFGVAKATMHSSRTESGTLKGKASHLAPEALRGNDVDARADVYSAGVLLWRCLTGQPPWRNPLKLLEREAPPRFSDHSKGPHEALDHFFARALAPAPEDRYASAAAMRDELEKLQGSEVQRRSERRALTEAVGELMKDERAALQKLIRDRIAELDDTAPTAVRAIPKLTTLESVPPEPTSISLRPAPSTDAPALPFRRLLMAGAAVLAALGTAYYWGQTSSSSDPPPAVATGSVASPASAGTSPLTASATSPVPDLVEVFIVAVPRHARIFMDGALQPNNPVTLQHRPDGRAHVVRVECPGYEAREIAVTLDQDRDLNVSLVRQLQPEPSKVDPDPVAPEPAPASTATPSDLVPDPWQSP
jgi:eukaryotic-like serine/threonine-protein kinase